MWFCMIEEPVGLTYRDDIGVDRIMWECDYPHADTPWPAHPGGVQGLFEGVPHAEVQAITRRNAEALFEFPLSDELIAQYATT